MATGGAPAAVKRRKLSLVEMQKYYFGYGAGISVFSCPASAYQLCKLYNCNTVAPGRLVRTAMQIVPHQTVLKMIQMNLSAPVKEHANPWAAFAVVGVLQGGVYGQSSMHFARSFALGGLAAPAGAGIAGFATFLRGLFRGSAFAAVRDSLSQGIPFVLAERLRREVLDVHFPTPPPAAAPGGSGSGGGGDAGGGGAAARDAVKRWGAIGATSLVATVASQGMHNCQLAMQSNQAHSYPSALAEVWRVHGVRVLWKGAEARVGLLLVVNVLNELLLKPAWEGVPVDE